MKFSFRSIISTSCICFAVFFASCKKESSVQSPEVNEQESQTITEESAAADAEYEEVTEIAMTADADLEIATAAGDETSGVEITTGTRIRTHIFNELSWRLGPCAEVTVSGIGFPKTVTINYGDGCLCRDGKFRKGAVILHFTGPLRRAGSVLTVTLRNYHVNRAHIEGIKTITNLSAAGVIKYSVKIQEGRVTWPSGRGFTYVGGQTVTQIEGMDTRTIRDDAYQIEGRNQTTYASGLVVVKNTETPLIKKISCHWLVQGIVKITINDRVLFINFGNGECDNKAIISWSGGEREITL